MRSNGNVLCLLLAGMVACAAAGSQDARPPVGSSFMVTPLSTAAQQPQSAARVLISATDSQGQIINAYRDVTCGNTEVFVAKTTAEVAAIVAGLAGSGKTIRAVSHRLPHSPSSFFCASLNGTGAPQATIVLDMKQVLAPLNPTTGLITVGASMDLYTLANIYEAGNRTLVSLSWPFHDALTVGGVFSVGGHGSSLLTGGLLIDQVKCVKYVNASGAVLTACRSDPIFRGLAGGMGMLGIVTEFTMETQPNSKTEVQVQTFYNDRNITKIINALRADKTVDSLFVFWRADVRLVGAVVGRTKPYTTPVKPAGGAFPPVPDGGITGPFQVLTAGLSVDNYTDVATALTLHNGPGGLTAKFPGSATTVNQKMADLAEATTFPVWAAYVTKNLEPRRLDPAKPDPEAKAPCVGRTNLLSMSYPCSLTPDNPLVPNYVCFYAPSPKAGVPSLTFSDVEVALPDDGKSLEAAIADYRRLVALDLAESVMNAPGVKPMIPLGSGVLVRWSKKSDTVLGLSGKSDVVWIGMENFELPITPETPYPNRNYFITTIMEQRLVCKYKALLHMGKNHDRAFLNPRCVYRRNIRDQLREFGKLQREVDPQRTFEPPLFRRIKTAATPKYYDGCEPAKDCYCTQDSHCAKGWGCKASLAFPAYKACYPPAGF